jgi:hypothetical protein
VLGDDTADLAHVGNSGLGLWDNTANLAHVRNCEGMATDGEQPQVGMSNKKPREEGMLGSIQKHHLTMSNGVLPHREMASCKTESRK